MAARWARQVEERSDVDMARAGVKFGRSKRGGLRDLKSAAFCMKACE